ncbi:MAG: ArsR/SmtB family transcription factor [Anaerolineae bacterium]
MILSKTTEPLSTTEKQRLLTMMKAIGHPMRFEILQFLMLNPNCYTKDIVEHLPISQATVSQHIKQLREAGWLSSEAVCQMTSHWLDLANIEWFKQTVGEMF